MNQYNFFLKIEKPRGAENSDLSVAIPSILKWSGYNGWIIDNKRMQLHKTIIKMLQEGVLKQNQVDFGQKLEKNMRSWS